MSPRFQHLNNPKQFSVIYVVVSFCRVKRLGQKGTGLPLSIRIFLKEDSPCCVLGRICSNCKWLRGIRHSKSQLRHEDSL
ncbi:hypothetical protein M404DRAFT_172262 [Pisolithus tinctorius Marx 270]|uniref:Uncharacterized protein n=1 Tax=Pisolithus tinctorius Marx 270 TaxID=870435 RepID=A0A0C3NAJ3_PISTI|nr:hypothetical protein M404DRAFT_172262 [Pisolithus tinctorius Marx 270]